MSGSSEACHAVVLGLLQRPGRMVESVVLTPHHFEDASARKIFVLARRYSDAKKGGNALDIPLARALLERSKTKKASALLPVVEEYATLDPVSDAEFRDAVSTLIAARRRALTKERATQAVEASLEGDDEKAREAMRRGLLEAEDVEDDHPEDLRSDAQFAAEVAELKKPKVDGESFDVGFGFLTSRTTFRRGQLTILCGAPKDGKSQILKTMVFNASVLSGARIFFTSLEMDKREMRILFVCHHASTIDPKGVPWVRILDRTASKADLRLYARALLDFRVREGAGADADEVRGKGGSIFLWAPRRRPTIAEYAARVRVMAQDQGIGVAVGDYLELFRPTFKTRDYRHDLSESCYDLKEMAREANVWALFAHQISRSGREAAEKRVPHHYIARDAGESSGVEKSASQLLWVYSDEALRLDHEARMGMAAVREGESYVIGEEIFFDPRSAYAAEVGGKS